MSRKKEHRRGEPLAVDRKQRIEKAVREGRFQQALELAKHLYKDEPVPEHKELVKKASLGRASQLHEQSYDRDAIGVLEAAQRLDPANPAWLQQVAEKLAEYGGIAQALDLLPQLPEAGQGKILGRAADGALLHPASGRAFLPPVYQADFDRIVQAFREVEAGQDEQARATLQPLGLRSPFLEWKILLRGLQAYYQNDDPRALENWQRLSPDRLPARLAAPWRFAIDPAFRAAQPPATQALLQQQRARLEPSTAIQQLRQLRTALGEKRSLGTAYRQVEALLPTLRQQAPHLVPRLASCFYWATLDSGPDDVLRYQRVFGGPPEDPHFHRLHALAYEKAFRLPDAHASWKKYEHEIATLPGVWPGDQAARARALIWLHMGRNAGLIPSDRTVAHLPRFLRDHPDRPRQLDPPAEKCFQRSLELAPDLLEAHEALFNFHVLEDQPAKALKAGKKLLERFPDHLPTLESLAGLLQDQGEPAEALALLQRALKNNPLNRDLRLRVSKARLLCASEHAVAGAFAEARQEYEAALRLNDSGDAAAVLCPWAACEFKAGDAARGEELLQQALGQGGSAVGVAYRMLAATARLKLPRSFKARFEKEFKEGLASPGSPRDLIALLDTAEAYQEAAVTYVGQKTHLKQILTCAEKARTRLEFSGPELAKVCERLIDLDATARNINGYLRMGLLRFPDDPMFPFLEAVHLLDAGPDYSSTYRVRYLLSEAERLARLLPAGPEQQAMLARIDEEKEGLQEEGGFPGGFFPNVFDMFGGNDEGFF